MAKSIQQDVINAKLESEADEEEAAKYTGPSPVPLNKSCYCNANDCKPNVTPVITVLY